MANVEAEGVLEYGCFFFFFKKKNKKINLLFQSPLTKTSGVFIEVHKSVYRGSTFKGSKVQKYIAILKAGVILYWNDHTIFYKGSLSLI